MIDSNSATSMSPTPLGKHRWGKIILLIIATLVFIAVAIFFIPSLLGIFFKDIDPIDYSDFSLKKVNVSDNENAYFDLIKLDNLIYEPEGKSDAILDIVAGKIWDENLAEEIVSKNSRAFEYFSEAARKPKFQDPAAVDPLNITPNTILPNMNVWRRMSRLSAIRAIQLAKRGKGKEAMEETLNSIKIGQKIQESQAPLIEYLVAMSMKSIGLETLQKISASSKLKGSELSQYAQELNQFYENEDGAFNAFKTEYHMISWGLDAISRGELLLGDEVSGPSIKAITKLSNQFNYYYHPNETKALFAGYTRVQIKTVLAPCSAVKEIEIPQLAPQSYIKLYLTENAIGKILHDVVASSLTSVSKNKCQEDLLVAATQTIIAIKAFTNENRNYPASLNELVPRYLPSIPQDPFGDKALKYSMNKKIIYSVGRDMQDTGGSTGDDWRQMSDPTFEIDF